MYSHKLVWKLFGHKKKVRIILTSLLFMVFIFLIVGNTTPIQSTDEYGTIDEVEITVLLDNYPNGTLQNPWGVSMLVETNDYTILFDTGSEPNALGNNSIALGKDLTQVDYVIISHEHWDHTYGLEYVAEVKPGVTVYVPYNMGTMIRTEIENLGFDVVRIHQTTILSPGIAIIGELYGPPYEHALAVNIANVGLVVVVGCSHPGVENHVEKAVTDLSVDPYLVIGGFHLGGAGQTIYAATTTSLLELGVDYIFPIHCSGDGIRAYIESFYPEYYREGCVGTHLIIDQTLATQVNSLGVIPVVAALITTPIICRLKKKRSN